MRVGPHPHALPLGRSKTRSSRRPQALFNARGAPPPRAAARSLEDSLLAAAAGAAVPVAPRTSHLAPRTSHLAPRPPPLASALRTAHSAPRTDYDVIAYTTTLTANFVLSSRWKRLFRQS